MTEQLYYNDSYQTEFQAQVLDVKEIEGKNAVQLDKTLFYPTSGGQMHDTGKLGELTVSDVIIQDDTIWHILDSGKSEGTVTGVLDWSRRFDFMQQHTGFHILAGSFKHQLGVETLASHLGEDFSTIETDAQDITDEQINAVELLANQIIWQNRSVKAFIATEKDLDNPDLRKVPGMHENVRLVEIDDFDLDPCGGTHVKTTGEVGVIKLMSRERVRGTFRFTFAAGGRAVRLFQEYHTILAESGKLLTTGFADIPAKIEKITDENKLYFKRIQQIDKEKEESVIQELCDKLNNQSLVDYIYPDVRIDVLRRIASAVIKQAQGMLLLGTTGENPALVFATSRKDLDLRPVFRESIAMINGKGGGPADFVQGGGPDSAKINDALQYAKSQLKVS